MNLLEAVENALTVRSSQLQLSNCCRLFDGLGDGDRLVVIDRFNHVAIIHDYSGGDESSRFLSLKNVLKEKAQIETAYCWKRNKDNDSSERGASLLWGPPNPEFQILIDGQKLIVRPERVPQAGVFLDSTQVRQFIADKKFKGRVINTFAYTGSLGIAAHLSGAAEVIQIDSSKSILAWAKENFEINKLPDGGMVRFIEEDSQEFLEKEHRRVAAGKRELCDLIILDPPTVGRSGKGMFRVHHDLPGLLVAAMKLLKPGGYLIAAVNAPDIGIDELDVLCEKSAGEIGKSIEIEFQIKPPASFYRSPLSQSSVMRGIIAWISG